LFRILSVIAGSTVRAVTIVAAMARTLPKALGIFFAKSLGMFLGGLYQISPAFWAMNLTNTPEIVPTVSFVAVLVAEIFLVLSSTSLLFDSTPY